ncbi:hypothetical protein [Kiloniella antarctica]|uniref:Uncharacterized protein n=1 Tax=Kiloniella antarctica TaxID=1550907 RepID=A0ABW5BH43_9PROT
MIFGLVKFITCYIVISYLFLSVSNADGVDKTDLLSTQACISQYSNYEYTEIFECTDVILVKCQENMNTTQCTYRNRASWLEVIDGSVQDLCILGKNTNLCSQLSDNSGSWERTTKEFCLILAGTYPLGALRNVEYASCLRNQTIVRALNVDNILQIMKSR